jgi:hypothetical protein
MSSSEPYESSKKIIIEAKAAAKAYETFAENVGPIEDRIRDWLGRAVIFAPRYLIRKGCII